MLEGDSPSQCPALLPPSWRQGQGPLQLRSARSPFLVPAPDIPATLFHLGGHTLLHFLRGLKGQGWCPLKGAQQGQQQPHFLPVVPRSQARLPTDHLPKKRAKKGGEGGRKSSGHTLVPFFVLQMKTQRQEAVSRLIRSPQGSSGAEAEASAARQSPSLPTGGSAGRVCGLPAVLGPTATWHAFTERAVSGSFSWKEAEMVTYPLRTPSTSFIFC